MMIRIPDLCHLFKKKQLVVDTINPWEKHNRYAGENVTDRESKRFSQGGVIYKCKVRLLEWFVKD